MTLATTVRLIPFIYNSSIAYKVEMGNLYMRFYYGDAVLLDDSSNEVWLTTPYLEADLFQIQYKQIGDVMWLTHPGYAPRKLTRTSPTEFSLDIIDFRKGPFLLQNDLVDPVYPSTTTLACSATGAGASGVLTATSSLFVPEHVGALFKLIHNRTTISTSVENITGPTPAETVCADQIRVKGGATFVTHGTWAGVVELRRNVNGAGWDTFRKYYGNNDRNIQFPFTEYEDNVMYAGFCHIGSGSFGADITVNDPLNQGIVKVTAFMNSFQVSCEVYSPIESTSATVRWCEGAWSELRGFPSTVTFLNGRCFYAGAGKELADADYSASQYPQLRL